MARCAMRNRQFTGYTLGPLECNVRGRLFDSEGGEGGSQNFVWTDNLFLAWARPGNFFHVAWARENLFSCKHGKPQSTEAITRNSNVIESSQIRWNY